jgi:hypothetical protein
MILTFVHIDSGPGVSLSSGVPARKTSSGLVDDQSRFSGQRGSTAEGKRSGRFKAPAILVALLAGFVLLLNFLPLATAIKIGADEDFEPSKATLCLHGYHLYTDVWDDQPPLHTFLITEMMKHVSLSILGPRLLTAGFAMLLLGSFFWLVFQANGLLAAGLSTAMLIASPGFLELSCSCMQEIPALAPAIAALCLLLVKPSAKWPLAEVSAGILFAVALQLKFIEAMYLPLFGLILWLRHRQIKSLIAPTLAFAGSLAISFAAIEYLTGNSLLLQFQQSWAAHFSSTRSFEYGSPSEHAFDWGVLPKNWDITLPALVGVVVLVRQMRQVPQALIPLAWLTLTMLVLPFHKPWWSYYYVHNAVPLCWCAGIGIVFVFERIKRNRTLAALLAVYALCAVSWMGARLYLQSVGIRNTPRLYASLLLKEINRFKPATQFMFTDQPIYSFHAQIPMPPHLAMISLKRLWSGDLSNAQIASEMAAIKPGLILLANDTREVPFQDSLDSEYRLVYQDNTDRLYALKSIKPLHR